MRTALFADIHANLEALQACLAHARGQGAERFALLGDYVNYGADPRACLDIVGELAASGAAVRGNHDEAALGGLAEAMHPVAREALYWTRGQLGEAERDFLADLPYLATLGPATLAHASLDRPATWPYVAGETQAGRCLALAEGHIACIGHIHRPQLYHAAGDALPRAFSPPPGVAIPLPAGRRWLLVCGSVGQPRDGIPAAAYALLDETPAVPTVTYFRVPYDYTAAAAKIVAAGLPAELAWRLQRGH
jgi:diadenosine tetraphosphatase ApaH/serine/threonine PP2A family protein phosphatase